MSKFRVYICGVFAGPTTGQMRTLLGVEKSLREKYELRLLRSPESGFFFITTWLSYVGKIFYYTFCKNDPNLCYLILHRSRRSFWLRDVPFFFLASWSESKLICHLVGSDMSAFIESVNWLEKFLIKRIFANINAWVVLGRSSKKQVENVYHYLEIAQSSACFKNGKLQCFTVKGYYANESKTLLNYKRLDKKQLKFGSKFTVGYMAHLIEEKGITEFIDAVIHLSEINRFDVSAWIAGGYIGRPSPKVVSAMKLAATKNYFDIKGFLRGKEKWNHLLKTQIFILPSYYRSEGLPIALIEAMRTKCLCISTSVGEIPDLLGGNRGVILDSTGSQKIVDAVCERLKNPEESTQTINNAYLYIKDDFSFDSFKSSIQNLVHAVRADN